MIGPTGVATALSSANAFSNRTRHASVCGPKPTQPLQPGVAPCAATLVVRKKLAILDLPLVRDPRSQTQFLARLHLYLVVAPLSVACPPLVLQCTIDTSVDKAHVLELRAALFLQLRASQVLWEPSYAPWVLRHRPAWLLQRDTGFRTSVSLASAACSPSAAVRGVSSSVLPSFDDNFEGLSHEEHSAAADHVKFFPVVFGYPTAILREVHIASRIHHGAQRPDWPSHVQHTVIRLDLSNLCIVTHLSHSVLFHFCS